MQALAPVPVRRRSADGEHQPDGHTATRLAFVLGLFPAAIAAALDFNVSGTMAIGGGLIHFGMAFALNSAVHSYMILAYTDHNNVAMNVGIYYMANACRRLAGTVLSSLLYQVGLNSGVNGGLIWCLLVSTGFVLAAALLSLGLPERKSVQPVIA